MVKVVDVDTTVDELSTAVVDNNEGIVTDDADVLLGVVVVVC